MKQLMGTAVLAVALAGAMAAAAEDGYIESDGSGGAGINTGFFFGPQSKIEIDCQLSADVELQSRLFGAVGTQNSDTKPECECYIGSNNGWKLSYICGKAGGARQASNFYPTDTQRHRIVLDFYEAKQFQVWTGDAKSTKALSAFPANRQTAPITFFCKNNTAYGTYTAKSTPLTFNAYTKMRVYRFRIWDAGVLVRDYTPLVKGGMPGFRENCSGQFVTGENIAAFTAGGDVAVEKDDPYIATPGNSPGILEDGKTLYWDTGYFVKPISRVELDYAILTNWATDNLYGGSGCNVLTCSGANAKAEQLYLLAYGPKTTTGYYYWKTGPNNSEGSIPSIGIDTANGVRRLVSMSGNSFDFITAGYTNAARSVTAGITVPFTKTLKINTYLPMKVYGLKIYESDELIKDYKPTVTNGVPQFIDVLNPSDSLLTTTCNGGGRTNVVAEAGGSIVCTDGSDEAYLEFDGVSGHLIDTGYMISHNSCIEADFAIYNTTYNSQQNFFGQDHDNANILVRLYINSDYALSYQFDDYSTYQTLVGINTKISAKSNERRLYKLDGYNSQVTITRGSEVLYDQPMGRDHNNTGLSKPLRIATNRAHMRLYGFKISEAGTEVRNYVPCVMDGAAGLYELHTKAFLPLAGGKVSGKGSKEVSGGLIVAPQAIRVARDGTGTLTCLAAGAQSYEWYEDGVKIEGETGHTLTVEWTQHNPHVRTYSVVPVYTVFNETEKGEAVPVQVEFTPIGSVFFLR